MFKRKGHGQPGGFVPPRSHPACTPAPVPQARAKQAGQSAVEFALIVTTAIIMFLGMVQFGIYLYGLSIVENAARNGARIGATSQGCTPCDATAAARSALQGQPVIRNAAVSVLAPGGVVGSTVRIRVTAHIPLVVPGGGTFGLGPLTTVSAESTFRQEGWRP
jgi:Flp pilus assembly protein TadG